VTARVRVDYPRDVRVIRHVYIPMSDGCRLAARIWLPIDAEDEPVPAVMEYVPYRKNDGLVLRDAPIHGYFAGFGYASVRVDMRGSGDSDGILEDEYLPLEQADGIEAMEWLAAQPWCTGKVGIIGKSWGGFNGLQIAAHSPEVLGAVISVASTDDRYADDVHYMGGCMLSATMLSWASTMFAYNAQPPDPDVVGEAWRDMWIERMEKTPPFAEAWVEHQRRDEFWKQGSVCEDFSSIRCPVYMVGGWSDSYRNAILRFLEGHPGPCKGLIGPWAHVYPESGAPGPAIGFLQEAVRWWDRWLKGIENGIMEEPKLVVYMPEALRPAPGLTTWPGRWLRLDGWPAAQVAQERLFLGAGGTLQVEPGQESDLHIRGAEAVATDAGSWGGTGGATDRPGDQRPEDGQSLSFDTAELAEPLEILGFPVVRLEVSSDRPQAFVAVRLCDVWPDGASTLVTRGFLNLTHRQSHEYPEPLVPGERYAVDVVLNSIAYSLPAGHRLRVAVSPTYWPWIWPSPESVLLGVHVGGISSLELPVLRASADFEPPRHFHEPEEAPTPAHVEWGDEERGREVRRDVASGRVDVVGGGGHAYLRLLEDGLEYRSSSRNLHRIFAGDPLSAFNSCEREVVIGRHEWRVRVHTMSTMSSTAEEFQLTNVLEGFEGERRVFAKTWERRIRRVGV
jgi:uncharacterized protein